jgi:Fic family protein
MKIHDTAYFSEYQKKLDWSLTRALRDFDGMGDIDLNYLTQTSAVYSANIEGNSLDINSYMNRDVHESKTDKTRDAEEISNLVEAYEFAQKNPLTEENMLHCHSLLSRTLLIESKQWKYREEKVGVFGSQGLIYLAVEHDRVPELMTEFFREIESCKSPTVKEGIWNAGGLWIEELFYHASLLHLIFAHIHPFADGNGRMARLLEKWFLATRGDEKYWKIPAEQFYKEHRPEYYQNINLWVNFYELDYSKCMPFLMMLPNSITNQ